jgi:hypothetical protein
MSEAVLTNGKLYLNEHDLSGQMNAIAADMSAESPESTAMGLTNKARLPGLKDCKVSLNGFFDSALFPQFGLIGAVVNPAMTIAPTGADGEGCFIFQPLMAKYSPGGKTGDVNAYKVEGEGTGPFVQGTILLPKLARTTSGAGTGRLLGSVTPSRIGAWTINAAGSGYSLNDVITVVQAGGSGATLIVTEVDTGGEVLGAVMLTRGTGYAVATALATTVVPNVGTGFKVNIVSLSPATKLYGLLHVFAKSGTPTLDVVIESDVSAAFLTINRIAPTLGVGYSVNAAGADYNVNDVITVVQSGGSGGTFTVTGVTGGPPGPVATFTQTTPGTGYAVANGLATTVAPGIGAGFKLNILSLTDTPVMTFAQKTAVGHEWKVVAGPFTDNYYRVKYTIGGGSPNITFAVVLGIW